MATEVKEIYEIGEIPPIGQVPAEMYAQVIRRERFGEPKDAFQIERVAVPEIGPDEVLVYVMAAGINYNNVWAALGIPVDVIRVHAAARRRRGLPHRRQRRVRHRLRRRRSGHERQGRRRGGRPLRHLGHAMIPSSRLAAIPIVAPSAKIWGYETNWGSFAQFTKVQAHQCLPKPPQPDLGSRRRLHARRRDRLPHAHALVAEHRQSGRRRARLGRRRRPRHDGDPDREGDGRRADRRRLER